MEGGAAAGEAPPREGGAGVVPSSPPRCPPPGRAFGSCSPGPPGGPAPPEPFRPGGARRRAGCPAPQPPRAWLPRRRPGRRARPTVCWKAPGRSRAAVSEAPSRPGAACRRSAGRGWKSPLGVRSSACRLRSGEDAKAAVLQGRQREPVLHAARPGPARAALPEAARPPGSPSPAPGTGGPCPPLSAAPGRVEERDAPIQGSRISAASAS